MKTHKFFAAATVLTAILMMVSCNDKEGYDNNDPAVVKFTSGVTAVPQSRVWIDSQDNSAWDAGDPVGIYMVEHGTTTITEDAANVKYTAATAGLSTSFSPSGNPIYYPMDETKKIDFIAYHPYNTFVDLSITNFTSPVNVSDQSSQTAIDLMYAVADNSGSGYDKNNGRSNTAINFNFEHQLAKLVFTVTSGTGAPTDLSTMTVSINGMNTRANFDLKGVGGLTDIGDPASITPFRQTGIYAYVYEAILLPESTLGNSHTVTFGIGAETYTWAMSDDIASLDAGSIYKYDLTLTKYAVNATGSIKKWTVGSAGNGIAE